MKMDNDVVASLLLPLAAADLRHGVTDSPSLPLVLAAPAPSRPASACDASWPATAADGE